jgi:competence protein ComEA
MLKRVIVSFLIFATVSLFAMSLKELNSASKTDLMQIKGIGEAKAEAILKERKKGKFESFKDLTRVKGVGESIANNVKNDVKSSAKSKKEHKTKK